MNKYESSNEIVGALMATLPTPNNFKYTEMNGKRKSDESERKFPIHNIPAVALRLSNNCCRSTEPHCHCFELSVGWRPNNEWQRDYVDKKKCVRRLEIRKTS